MKGFSFMGTKVAVNLIIRMPFLEIGGQYTDLMSVKF